MVKISNSKKLIFSLVVSLLLSGNAYARYITVEMHLSAISTNNKSLQNIVKERLEGAYYGFQTSNTELTSMKRKEIFCQPDKLGLNVDNLIRFLNDEIKLLRAKGANIDKFPIESILMNHLKKVFPCK